MRKAGYTLLGLGYLWLVVWCAPIGPMLRAIAHKNMMKYAPDQTYHGTDVQAAIRDSLFEYMEAAHGIVLPASLMLVGGILLDRSARKSAGNGKS
jgi:hypothetical protein